MKPSKDPSVNHEPHLGKLPPSKPTPGVEQPEGLNIPAPQFSSTAQDHVDYSVWDEPALGDLAGKPKPGDLTYENWLSVRVDSWSQGNAWAATLVIGVLSGLWALGAAMFGGYTLAGEANVGVFGFLVVCGFAPLAQEICKVAIPLWVVEKRPYYFTGWFQIFLCSIMSATIFVAVNNAVSLFFIPPESRFGLMFFWSAYLLMHVICSALAAFGIERIWHSTMSTMRPPKMELGYPWFMSAFLVHAAFATGLFLYRVLGGEL